VQQPDRTDTDSEQDQTLEKFKGCDYPQAARGACRTGSLLLLLMRKVRHRVISDYIVLQPSPPRTIR
jgi:hypothetical protein